MKLNSLFTTLLFLFLLQLNAVAQTNWIAKKASVTFSIKNAGLNVNGSVKGLQATIAFDEASLAQSHITASVDVNTIETGIDMRNKHLKKEEYFNTEKFERIYLKSKSFIKNSDGSFTGIFYLTIKNVTKEITLPFAYTTANNTAEFKGTFKINRRDFEIGGKSLTMSDEVSVSIWLSAEKKL